MKELPCVVYYASKLINAKVLRKPPRLQKVNRSKPVIKGPSSDDN